MIPARNLFIAFLVCTALMSATAAALTVAMGDEVVITGTNPGGQDVYLFLTGPNLPREGVRLNAVVTGSSSSFTRAEVLADGTWRYAWDTKGVGGVIDTGSYTLFAVTEPAGRQDLAGKLYTSLGISLREPGITVVTATSPPAGQGTTPATTTPATASPSPLPGTPESRVSTPPATATPVPVPVEVTILACVVAILSAVCFRR
jgi:hypothetical protein